jgi:hypothetical protein
MEVSVNDRRAIVLTTSFRNQVVTSHFLRQYLDRHLQAMNDVVDPMTRRLRTMTY